MGTEWWMRRASKGKERQATQAKSIMGIESHLVVAPIAEKVPQTDDIQGVLKARVSTNAVSPALLYKHRVLIRDYDPTGCLDHVGD